MFVRVFNIPNEFPLCTLFIKNYFSHKNCHFLVESVLILLVNNLPVGWDRIKKSNLLNLDSKISENRPQTPWKTKLSLEPPPHEKNFWIRAWTIISNKHHRLLGRIERLCCRKDINMKLYTIIHKELSLGILTIFI